MTFKQFFYEGRNDKKRYALIFNKEDFDIIDGGIFNQPTSIFYSYSVSRDIDG